VSFKNQRPPRESARQDFRLLEKGAKRNSKFRKTKNDLPFFADDKI
jgi:hypothetical protein